MIVAGFGFRAAAPAQSLRDVFDRTRGGRHVNLLAAPDDKVDSLSFQTFAMQLNVPVFGVAPTDLHAQTTLTVSRASLETRGTGSVAEAAALAAAGPNARLLGPRVVSSDGQATCALAEGGQE